MRTLCRSRFADLLPPPTPVAIVLAVFAGSVFAGVALTVQDASFTPPSRKSLPELRQAFHAEQQRTMELLQKIEAKAEAQDRSEVPAVIIRELPRVAVSRPASRIAAATPVTGIWSAQAENRRAEWRRWADRRLAE